jgi:hypothetical protein
VYSNFASMEELENAVFRAAAGKLLDFATSNYTDNPFLNMGVGVLKFARECPRWYHAFSIRHEYGSHHLGEVMERQLEVMAGLPGLQDLHPLERRLLMRKMEIFTHGMAAEICAGPVSDTTMTGFISILQEVGEALTAEALLRPPRDPAELEQMADFFQEGCLPCSGESPLTNGDDNHEN